MHTDKINKQLGKLKSRRKREGGRERVDLPTQ